MKENDENSTCCPPFNPDPWDDKMFEWNEKLFIRKKVKTFFFMPLNFGSVMSKVIPILEAHGNCTKETMCLSDHTSRWNMDILLSVNSEIPGLENVKLNGKFYSRVYEGNFNKTGEWCKHFENEASKKGFAVKKWYMWYTTCPKCAKKYGKNYVVVIAEVN